MEKDNATSDYVSPYGNGRATLSQAPDGGNGLVAEKLAERARSSRKAEPAVLEKMRSTEEESPGKRISDLQYSLAGFLTENAALLAALRECSPNNPLACDDDLRKRLRKKGREAFDKERTWEAAILVGNQVDIHLQ